MEQARVLTSSVNGETLLSATDANKKLLVDLLDERETVYGTSFEAGLTKAFDVLDNSRNGTQNYSGCKTAIIFLSDGYPVGGLTSGADLAQLVEDRNTIYDARLFTFTLGQTGAEVSVFRLTEQSMLQNEALSCAV